MPSITNNQEAIFLKQKKRIEKIFLPEIYAIEATEGGECKIYTYSKTYTIRITLKKMKEKLVDKLEEDFIQINRATMVRIRAIDSINTETNEVEVNKQNFTLSRLRRQGVFRQLEIL